MENGVQIKVQKLHVTLFITIETNNVCVPSLGFYNFE